MARKKYSKAIMGVAATLGGAGLLAGVGAVVTGRAMWKALASPALLTGKVVLITGGSRGLGLALAEECAIQGCRVAICGREIETLARAEHALRARNSDVLAIRCDVSHADEIAQMVDKVIACFGRIDVLINNAGTILVGPLSAQSSEDFHEAMDVIYWGTVNTTLAVLPHMLAQGGGSIANITSIGGKMAVPHLLPYSAAKFAAVGFSEGITAELAEQGIQVTTVVPGLMRTGSHVNALFKGNNRAEYAWFGVSASAPLLAMSADRAARKIIDAIRRGDAELILGLPAKLAARVHGLFPGTTVRALGLVNRVLPHGSGSLRHRGHESEGAATRSQLTAFGKKAARRWNQERIA